MSSRSPPSERAAASRARLHNVLRAGMRELRERAARVAENEQLEDVPPKPVHLLDIPEDALQMITEQLAKANAGNALDLCNNLRNWCKTHPKACSNEALWREVFEVAFGTPVMDPPPAVRLNVSTWREAFNESLKGVSGDVIILEEAAYCDPGLVAEVVVPLLSMQQSVLLCISTILDSGNHYSKMMEMVDDYGHPIFESIKITLVCDDCLKTDHPEKCRHKLASMPRWLSSKKVETVRALLAEDPAMLLRESLGISADGSEKAFHTTDIEALMKRVPDPIIYDVRNPESNVNHIFVACDPSGGGASAFSVASLVQDARGFSHILGVEALHTKDVRQTHGLLVRHLATIRKMHVFAHCRIVLIFESNLAFESQHLLHAVEGAGIKNWVSLSEGQQGSLGWLTTNERKQQMCLLLREAMTVGKIALAHQFFSNELGTPAAKTRIKDELSSYCVVTEAPKTTFGKVRQTYTGKLYGKQDDLCIAIQLSLIGCQKFFQDSKYRNFRAPDYLTPNGL